MKHALLAFAAFLGLASLSASAQFMKPGASPEAGLAGVWRVIDAQPAPWAGREPHSGSPYPLLEYAIEFSSGEVKGPAAVACTSAAFSSGVTAPDDLFDGRLKNAKGAANAFHVSSSSVTTYRVICGGKPRDYYVDDDAALVMSDAGIVYTLERPTGMDPQQYTAAFSGPSFDCAKAKSAGERTICRDAALSKADRKLHDAFLTLKAAETPASFATVQASQRAWLAYVTKSCRSGGAMPDDVGDKNALRECLDDNYTDRGDRLEAVAVAKAGALVIEPRMRVVTRSKPETEESDIYPWMAGGPRATAFNAYVSRTLGLDKHRMDDKDLFPFGEEVADMKLYARRTYSVARFDERVASLQIQTFDYTGGAHEAIGEASLNWDMARAKPFALDDVFDKDKPWRAFVTDFCMKDLHDGFAEPGAPDPDREAVESVVGDSDNWLWGKEAATVHFTVYAIASFAAGESDVEIPYDVLAPYLRADAVVVPPAKP